MKEKVEIYPSFWFVVATTVFIIILSLLRWDISKTTNKLDTLIKIEQQILMYSQK